MLARFIGAILAGAVLTACVQQPQSTVAGGNLSPDVLLEKAHALAELELARLSAAEMIYRNKVWGHVYTNEDNGNRNEIVMKYYRNFLRTEVVDVKRTDSLLYPVEFIIRYDFDYLGTQGENANYSTLAQVANNVKKDNAFQVIASDSLVRQYRCDGNAECDTIVPDLLPRPNFWNLNPTAVARGILEVYDLSALAGS